LIETKSLGAGSVPAWIDRLGRRAGQQQQSVYQARRTMNAPRLSAILRFSLFGEQPSGLADTERAEITRSQGEAAGRILALREHRQQEVNVDSPEFGAAAT
jgi:hypothetical protein